MVATWVKTVVIPPVIALAVYFLCVHFLVPLYRRRQLYSQYLPVALAPSDEPSIVSRARGRIQQRLQLFLEERLFHRRSGSRDLNFGDEELDEDILPADLHHLEDDMGTTSGRRLSRDLEAGFRDDSDDEREGDDTQRRFSTSRR